MRQPASSSSAPYYATIPITQTQIRPHASHSTFCRASIFAYSLVIDRSVVNGFIDARNLRVKGDFSFEHALILDTLRLNRANVTTAPYTAAVAS